MRGTSVQVDDVTGASGDGRLAFHGRFDPTGETFDGAVSTTAFPLQPVAWPAEGGGTTAIDVGGRLDASIQGRGTLAKPVGKGRVSLRDARYAHVRPGDVDVTLDMTGDGTARLSASAPALATTAAARVAVTTPFAYEATATLTQLTAARLVDAGVLGGETRADIDLDASATLTANGALSHLDASTVDVAVASLGGRLYGLPVALVSPARVRVSGSEISTDGIALSSGGTRVDARGRLAPGVDGDLRVDAAGDLADLSPLAARFSGRAALGRGRFTATVSASGPVQAPRLSGGVAVEAAALQLDGWPIIDGLAVDAALADGRIDLRRFAARVDDATLSASGGVPLRLLAGFVPERVLGANPSTGEAKLSAAATNLSLATLGKLAGNVPGGDLSGRADVRAELAASRLAWPAITGTVSVDRGTVNVGEAEIHQVGVAEIHVAGGQARFEEWRWTGAGTDIALLGDVDFVRRPVAYAVEARGLVDLSLIGAVLPGRTAGSLRADVRASRGHGDDGVTGELVIAGGAWLDRASNVALSDLSGTIRLRNDRMVSDGLTGRLNGGEVTVTGALGWPDGTLRGALSIVARGVTLEYPTSVLNDVEAELQLASPGPRDTPLGITGTARVRPGVLTASLRELAAMFTPGTPPLPTPERERRQRLFATVGLDVAVETADDLLAETNDLRAQASASVRLTGTLASPGMLGRADIRADGELFLAARLYEIDGGRIDFVDANRIDPRITLVARTRISEYEVEMQLTGPIDRVQFRLRSDPPLGQGDLASLLTTGQTLKERREQSETAASESAGAQVLSAVSSEQLGRIGRLFGVDTIRIENSTRDLSAADLDPVARLSVSKGLGPYLEVVYSQSLQENDDLAWILRYRPGWRDIEAKATFTTGDGETYEIRQELRFGGGASQAANRKTKRPIPPRVSSVVVTGVPAAEATEIAGDLALRRGKRFDAYKWQRDRKRVEGYYRDRDRLRTTVSAVRTPSPDGGEIALEFQVERGPLSTLRVEGFEFDS